MRTHSSRPLHRPAFFTVLTLAAFVSISGCTCGDGDDESRGREPVTATTEPKPLELEPLPEAPQLDVSPEALPGADGTLAVVTARPQGAVRGAVRPAVTFSKPVKSLADVESQRAEDRAAPFARIDPPLPGEWRWLGSASAEFVPEGRVPYASRFTVTVLEGLRAIDGSTLAADHTFSFSTPPPEVQDTSPQRGHRWLTPDQTLKVLFNQPVKDLLQHTQLLVEGEGTPRTLELVKVTSIADERRADDRERHYERLSDDARGFRNMQTRYELQAEQPLPLDRAITLRIADTLPGEEGPLTLGNPIELGFRTYGPLRLSGASFCSPHQAHCPNGPLVIATSNEVELNTLKERLEITPAVELDWDASSTWAPHGYHGDSSATPQARVFGAFKPGTAYQVAIKAGVRDVFGQSSQQPFASSASTSNLRPSLWTGGENALIESSKGAALPVEVVNLRRLDVALWSLTPTEAARVLANGIWEASRHISRPPDHTETQDLRYARNEKRLHRIPLDRIFEGEGKTGLALVRLDSADLSWRPQGGFHVLVQVTNLAAHLKIGPAQSAVWVTELSSGKGAANVQVSILDRGGAARWTGTTDAEGLVDVPGAETLIPGESDWSEPFTLVTATRGGDTGITASSWQDGIAAWDFNLMQGWEGKRPDPSGFVFTERGIYRPGETVHVKGLARYRTLGALKAPKAGSELQVIVRDSRGEDQTTQRVKVTKFGTFALEAVVPMDAPTGWYSVEASGNAPGGNIHFSTSFRVEEYRAPQFKVDVLAETQNVLAGEQVNATVIARYLFGGAMSEVPVRWSAHRASQRFAPAGLDAYVFGHDTWWWDDGEPGEQTGFVGSGEGRADGKGSLTIHAGTAEAPGERTWQYTIEAEVEDVSRQRVANRTSLTVHPGQLYVGVRPPSGFSQAGQPVTVEALVTDTTGKRTGGRAFEVEVVHRTWRSVRQKDAGGGLTTVSEPVEQTVHTCPLTSNAQSAVSCAFTPKDAGFYILRGRVKDDQGRSHAASTGLYVTGAGFVSWQRNDTERIELVPDKARYEVGETAKVLVKSPYPKARALVTIEREGVLERRVMDLEGSAVTVDVPITDAMVPNVFLGVVVVRPRVDEGGQEAGDDPGRPAARVGLVQLGVERSAKRLAVEVKTERDEYRPGEEVTVRLAVRDHQGRGTPAELTVFAVDEAVLRLTDYKTPDPIASIFPERPLSVRLAEPLIHLVRRRSYGEKGEEEGGGGAERAGAEGSGFRAYFRTTAFFEPDVIAGADGTATVRFKLPDNLTSYRVMAVAVSADDRFGSGEETLRVAKPLLALPALPRFARVGDSFEAGVVVHARDGQGEITVTAQVQNATLNGEAERRITLEPGKPREVRFAFTADRPGEATFRFRVQRGADSDGVEQKLPIEMPVGFETVATYGDTRDERVEGLAPPEGARPEEGGLEVTLASTAMGNFGEGFRQLVEYPYGCLEQQTSRLIPFVALRELGPKFGIPWASASEPDSALRRFLFHPATAEQAEGPVAAAPGTFPDPDEVIRRTVTAIEQLQADDGSFRYWSQSWCTHSFSSAYATLALHRAKEVGFEVNAQTLAKAQGHLRKVVAGQCNPCERTCPDDTRVFAAWVLARTGKPQASAYGPFYARRDTLPLFTRALLADAMFVGGGNREQARTLMQEILNHAKESPKGVHFEEVHGETYAALWHSDTRTTGAVLQTLATVSPDHPYVSKIANYLNGVRQDGRWRSTQEAAFSLMGLTEVVRVKEKDEPDFAARVALGGTTIAEERFAGRSTALVTKRIPMSELLEAQGDRKLTFRKDGAGVLYYGATLRYAPKEVPTKPLENGLFVQRWFEPFEGGGQATRFRAGELVRVRLRVASNQERHYAAFEVPLPAGLEPVDTSLASTAGLARRPGEEGRDVGYEYEDEADQSGGSAYGEEGSGADGFDPWLYGFWSPFNHVEQRDSRVVLFADHLPPGVHTTSFIARATTPGKFVLRPAHGELMYEPEVFGRSGGGTFEVVFPEEVSQR